VATQTSATVVQSRRRLGPLPTSSECHDSVLPLLPTPPHSSSLLLTPPHSSSLLPTLSPLLPLLHPLWFSPVVNSPCSCVWLWLWLIFCRLLDLAVTKVDGALPTSIGLLTTLTCVFPAPVSTCAFHKPALEFGATSHPVMLHRIGALSGCSKWNRTPDGIEYPVDAVCWLLAESCTYGKRGTLVLFPKPCPPWSNSSKQRVANRS
jgi:hypothetical protein